MSYLSSILAGCLAATFALGQAPATAQTADDQSSSDAAGTGQSSSTDPQPITGDGRVIWAVKTTVGPASIFDGALTAGWGTLMNHPREDGTHWEGFGQRLGVRFSSVAVGHTLEAGLGAIWGEDPRYFREKDGSFAHRLVHVTKMTFLAQNSAGEIVPAYARYIGITGSNFLSNAWRPDSEDDASDAGLRIGFGFLSRFSSNLWDEFWPDLKTRVFRRGR